MAAKESIQRSSTEAMPPGMRFDYWLSMLRQSLWPVSEWNVTGEFNFNLQEASLGCLTSMREEVSPHHSRRTRADVDGSRDRCYLLFANQHSWQVAHRGRLEKIPSGDCVLVDSQGELETVAPSGFRGIILKLPVDWLQTWVPNPESLVGGRIAKESRWGRVFSPIVSQLTPELAASPPLPSSVLVDQLGAVLGLIAHNAESRGMPDLLTKIQDCIRQRCSEPQLSAAEVAASLDVPPRILHRVLAANDLTFASQLIEARINVALQMLTSPSCTHLTTFEIARQSGFLSASHFARVVRKRTGRKPLELRRLIH
jgi:AraC-like DNA-binding protein